ncbi:MAG: DUF3800 domain-containing protein [Candidatus Binatus sp.]|uniref:DUF3800 domain-containing protein n=1 Tax=Candidatus Binatus sp. TaxID=2811406 RepID=UPI00271D4388|nr:DUF3800 domain-containing protein [Candidatus Binatus sp.]MDO8431057.1 DUF3800 domain-containing protein [Candidatus Binatus sp.]
MAKLLRSKRLFVLDVTGYFDEGGTHAQAPVIVVAGYLSPARDWRRFEIKWNKVLRQEGALLYHATDAEAKTPRGVYEGWTREKVDRLTDRLVPIAAQYAGRAYGVHMLASVWYAAVPFVKEFLPERSHDGPYKILAKDCIETVVNTQGPSFAEQITFVFERNDYSSELLAGYEIIKQISPRPSLLGPIAFDEKIENPMLQAADLIAWHYRVATEIRQGFRNDPIHRAALKLFKPTDAFRFVPKEEFCNQIADAFRRNGARWNEQVFRQMIEREERRLAREERGRKAREAN